MTSNQKISSKRIKLPLRITFVSVIASFLAGLGVLVFEIVVAGFPASVFNIVVCILVTMLISSAIGYVTYRITEKLLGPINTLAKEIRRLRPGQGDGLTSSVRKVSDELADAVHDMTAKYDAIIRKTYQMSISDPLTGLINRAHFLKKTEAYILSGGERTVSVVIVDLDRFSRVNDKFGPQLADELLVMVGARLKAYLLEADSAMRPLEQIEEAPSLLSRLAADTYAIVIPYTSQKVVEKIVEFLRFQLEKPFTLDGRLVELTAAYAAASAPQDAPNAVELMKQVDFSLKTSKHAKFKGLRFYDSSMQESAQRNLTLEDDIRRGIENKEFIPVFQPKIELETGVVIGAEALARWRRPDGAVVSPGVFVPKAEELGLIPKMGENILREACIEAAKWDFNGHKPRLAVNVSPLQFEDPNFVDMVNDVLTESRLPAKQLELELTETAAVDNPERVAKIMRPLRAKGVRFAIDDFGTGHSNFTTVTRLPFDVFKIDQQFVRAHGTDPHAPAIIEMILAMAEALGQETVAEGVETREHYEFLRRRACTIGQGYFFSPPLPAHEFESFVHHWRSPELTKKLA
ncbi:putative bifunctional diguanylate cyclase/phosphodiesterase [Hirschia maritima]|uniref:putative bifunctional diguanylate cyclase/phosphodiesterase n=1 Tax=Hirschia maritima TaxID=1121961 RepID=UPI00037E9B05|nr:GGDEF domain-containing phosphodiesterase [Hirschia maritima]